MNKSLIILSALTVAAATWYVGERFYAGSTIQNAPAAQDQQTDANPAVVSAALDASKVKEQSDASKLQALLKGQNAAALAAAELAVENANTNLGSALEDEYSEAYDAIYNKTDVLFKNAKTSPSIIVPAGSAGIQSVIDAKRQEIGILLSSWKSSDAPVVAAYLTQLEIIVATLTPGNSGLTQAQINAYQNAVSNASQQVNNAISDVVTAQAASTLADDELTVQQDAGNTENIQQAENDVNQDQANIAALEAELAAEAEAAAANGSASTTTTGTTGDTDTNTGNNNAGNNPGNYTYGSGSIEQQQAQFQEIIKNGPPELLNF